MIKSLLLTWRGQITKTDNQTKRWGFCILFLPTLMRYIHIHSNHSIDIHKSQSGASGLPSYCAPLVCVPDVIGVLAACWHNKNKRKYPTTTPLGKVFKRALVVPSFSPHQRGKPAKMAAKMDFCRGWEICDHARVWTIDKPDEARTNADAQMMLVQHYSGDSFMS